MKITVFTSNQARHLHLIQALAEVGETIYAVQECNTVFPGEVADFYRKSDIMQRYFTRMLVAEKNFFSLPHFLPANVRQLALKMGDLNKLSLDALGPALQSDLYVVFGSSYIKGDLIKFLVERKALNIHMGLSPYYRGTACNFWALYDGRPDMVGATVHLLSEGLDSGAMLFHAVPRVEKLDGFALGMKAVVAAHRGLVDYVKETDKSKYAPVIQDKTLQLRYSRMAEFTDAVAEEYLEKESSADLILDSLKTRELSSLLRPAIY